MQEGTLHKLLSRKMLVIYDYDVTQDCKKRKDECAVNIVLEVIK